MTEMITAWEAIDRVMTKAEEAGGWGKMVSQGEGGVMDDLRWAIDKFDERWYIFDTKTETTVCESMVLEPLETIIELLAVCEALMPCFIVRDGGPNTWDTLALVTAYSKARAALAKVKQDD